MRKANKIKSYSLIDYLICFSVTALILIGVFAASGIVPFGNNSLAWNDANIQFLDLFAYYKDVLSGTNSLEYTFSKQLGGNAIAIFSYYLASPFLLLVCFFDKSELHLLFSFLVILKLGLASVTMHYFIVHRFKDNDNKHFRLMSIILSVSYALSQYTAAQSSNIMWIDGVYMLPLILYGVYQVSRGKSGITLIITVGLSMLFNWYTGCINCLFSLVWLILELSIRYADEKQILIKQLLQTLIRYGFSMIFGIMISAVLFLPSIEALLNSGRSDSVLSGITDLSIIDNPLNTIKGFMIGSKSSFGNLSLFAGNLVLIGCVGTFANKQIKKELKYILAAFVLFLVLIFYWSPLINLYSLLIKVESYWYRYSYLGIFSLVFIASINYSKNEKYNLKKIILIVSITTVLIIPFVFIDRSLLVRFILTIAFLCIYYFLFYKMNSETFEDMKTRRIFETVLSLLVIIELSINSHMIMNKYISNDVNEFREYSISAQKQIDAIKEFDKDYYRISQTKTRNTNDLNLTANYNEALAYNYFSISGYTSSSDTLQKEMLNSLGYRINGENMCVINTSIISSDSLFSVKYVLSDLAINGYEEVKEIEPANNKKVYKNPFSLPIAFVYDENDYLIDNDTNPFEHNNQIYSKISGEEINLFIPLNYEFVINKEKEITISVDCIEGNYAYYGNLPWDRTFNGVLNVNDAYITGYGSWLSPSVFFIPRNSDSKELLIRISSEDDIDLQNGNIQFYALNLDLLNTVSKTINDKKIENIEIKNGLVEISVDANKDENLFISIPYDKGWKILVNGIKTDPELFDNCLLSLPIREGNSKIEMSYSAPGLSNGFIISLVGVFGLIVVYVLDKKAKSIKHI